MHALLFFIVALSAATEVTHRAPAPAASTGLGGHQGALSDTKPGLGSSVDISKTHQLGAAGGNGQIDVSGGNHPSSGSGGNNRLGGSGFQSTRVVGGSTPATDHVGGSSIAKDRVGDSNAAKDRHGTDGKDRVGGARGNDRRGDSSGDKDRDGGRDRDRNRFGGSNGRDRFGHRDGFNRFGGPRGGYGPGFGGVGLGGVGLVGGMGMGVGMGMMGGGYGGYGPMPMWSSGGGWYDVTDLSGGYVMEPAWRAAREDINARFYADSPYFMIPERILRAHRLGDNIEMDVLFAESDCRSMGITAMSITDRACIIRPNAARAVFRVLVQESANGQPVIQSWKIRDLPYGDRLDSWP